VYENCITSFGPKSKPPEFGLKHELAYTSLLFSSLSGVTELMSIFEKVGFMDGEVDGKYVGGTEIVGEDDGLMEGEIVGFKEGMWLLLGR
jgi:hypothetical protein